MPFKLIRFERTVNPLCLVQFSRNPSPGDYGRQTAYLQPKERSDAGDWYIYDKGLAPENTRTLHWKNIPAQDYRNLMGFISAVKGAAYDFIFTDIDGTIYTARILNSDKIPTNPVMAGRESVTIELLLKNILTGSEWDSPWGNIW